ncbi:hypothetical protein D9M69_456710 [compost metagenome]
MTDDEILALRQQYRDAEERLAKLEKQVCALRSAEANARSQVESLRAKLGRATRAENMTASRRGEIEFMQRQLLAAQEV